MFIKKPKILEIFEPEVMEEIKTAKRHSVRCIERKTSTIYRRAFSETQLLDVTPKNLKEGYSYNYITAGDVDALSYLKVILRQQNLDYCLLSTWVMAADDVLQFEEWLRDGKIKKLDAYVGEVYPASYKNEYKKLVEVVEKYNGRVCTFKNHSKIFAGIGQKFAFGIQTSANINTNPRTENGCITIGKDIYEFYKEYFDGVVSFNKSSIKAT